MFNILQQRDFYAGAVKSINLVSVLVLAGVELIFFTVASMGLCFEFVLETVLIIQVCFSYC